MPFKSKPLRTGTGLALSVLAAGNLAADLMVTGQVTDNGTTTIVGVDGVGTYTVDDGFDAVEGIMRFGETATGNGTGLVTGTGSSLTLENGVLNVGNRGTGLFTVADGADVLITRDSGAGGSQGGFIIAQEPGSVGEIVVTGAGSSLTGTGPRILMGGSGQATLTVENNATVDAFGPTIENPSFRIAQRSDGQATINVRTGGLLDLTGPGNDVVFLPERGSATLNIESGGRMLAGLIRVAQVGTAHADINITGTGSELEAEFLFAAQDPDTTVTIDVEDQGRLHVTRWLYVGQEGTGSLNVSGGSVVDVDEDLFVGGEIGAVAGDGTMMVTDGSTVTVADDMYISTDISTGVFSIFDDGSTLTVNDRFWVGWGLASAPADGTLEVGRGALIEAPGNGPSSNSGLRFAVAANDTATMRFIIGDDGTGFISAGLIETGALRFGSGTALLDIDVDSLTPVGIGDVFTLIDYDTTDGGLFDNVADDTILTSGAYQFLINYDTDLGGGDFALTATVVAIPEPAALTLLAAAAGFLSIRRRRPDDEPYAL
ncbi:MAG: PEP-CTERM sorting domain-containing protein [Planctomycetota bacterium]